MGMRGIRIQTISRELQGERIDVVEWSDDPETLITNALSLPSVMCVTVDESNPGGRTASVVVMDDQLSLAIGRSGQNARLAAKLTNWRIDIQGGTEAALWALDQVNQTPELLDVLKGTAALLPRLATIVRMHEEERYPYTDEERNTIATVVKAVRHAIITRREAERPGSVQARARQRAQRKADADRVKAKEEAYARVPRKAYEISLTDLALSSKVHTNLVTGGLQNVGEVMERMAVGDEALLMLNGVGVKALQEIKQAVQDSGLSLLEPADTDAVEAVTDQEIEVAEEASEREAVAEATQPESVFPETAEAEMAPEAPAEPEIAEVAEAGPSEVEDALRSRLYPRHLQAQPEEARSRCCSTSRGHRLRRDRGTGVGRARPGSEAEQRAETPAHRGVR